jgi:glycerophosphoryl diester phosphodiesterase
MGDYVIFGPDRPVLLGHRGCGRGIVDGYSENTLESFLAAIELGADWLEVDVRRTADDTLVVAHNPAEDDGVFYTDITGDQACDRGTLRLEQLLEALPSGVGVDFDLKTSMEDAPRDRSATTAAMLAPIATLEARHRPVLITSFDPGALDITRELAPRVPRGLLTWLDFPIGHAVAAAGHLDVQVLASHCGSLRPNTIEPEPLRRPLNYVIDLVHQSGRQFLAWCPGPEFAEQLIEAGADALCVNDVGNVLTALASAAGAAAV